MTEAAFWKRVAVLGSALTGTLLCDFADFHEAAEDLLERPVLTHEFANKQLMADLKEKALEALKAHKSAGWEGASDADGGADND